MYTVKLEQLLFRPHPATPLCRFRRTTDTETLFLLLHLRQHDRERTSADLSGHHVHPAGIGPARRYQRLPETAQTACNTEYLSVIADVDYRIHPRWNLYVKGAYETGKVYKANGPFAKGMYRRSWNAQSSLEFFPIKNSDLFIFLLYTYRGVKLEKAALDMGAVDPDTHRISLGLVYSIPVF